jgi:hypothetical protein
MGTQACSISRAVASARQIAKLLNDEVSLSAIISTVSEIRK